MTSPNFGQLVVLNFYELSQDINVGAEMVRLGHAAFVDNFSRS